MQSANPDPGALKKYEIVDNGKKIVFYNVFAANDPESTAFVYRLITGGLDENTDKMIMLNSRADRFFRSKQLIDICVGVEVDYIILTGEIPEKVYNYAVGKGIMREKMVVLGEIAPELVYAKAVELTKREAHILGIGNIAGVRKYGALIVKEFKREADRSRA
jgi:hypothetical protein